MDISCDIIRDVLPLYAEDMASPATRDMVDDHLCGCDGCTKELAELLKKPPIPVDVDTNALKRISHAIRNKKILTVIAVLLTVFTVVWSGWLYLTMPYYLTADEAIEGVILLEDGGIAIDWARGITGQGSFQVDSDYFIFAYTSRYDWYMGRREDKKVAGKTEEELRVYVQEKYGSQDMVQKHWDRFYNIDNLYCFLADDGSMLLNTSSVLSETLTSVLDKEYTLHEPDFDLWYMGEDGRKECNLWAGADGAFASEIVRLSSFSEQYKGLFAICLVLMIASCAAAWVLRGKKRREFVIVLGIAAASVVFTHLLVTGGDMVDMLGARAVHWGQHYTFTVLMLSLTALSWRKLMLMNKSV